MSFMCQVRLLSDGRERFYKLSANSALESEHLIKNVLDDVAYLIDFKYV